MRLGAKIERLAVFRLHDHHGRGRRRLFAFALIFAALGDDHVKRRFGKEGQLHVAFAAVEAYLHPFAVEAQHRHEHAVLVVLDHLSVRACARAHGQRAAVARADDQVRHNVLVGAAHHGAGRRRRRSNVRRLDGGEVALVHVAGHAAVFDLDILAVVGEAYGPDLGVRGYGEHAAAGTGAGKRRHVVQQDVHIHRAGEGQLTLHRFALGGGEAVQEHIARGAVMADLQPRAVLSEHRHGVVQLQPHEDGRSLVGFLVNPRFRIVGVQRAADGERAVRFVTGHAADRFAFLQLGGFVHLAFDEAEAVGSHPAGAQLAGDAHPAFLLGDDVDVQVGIAVVHLRVAVECEQLLTARVRLRIHDSNRRGVFRLIRAPDAAAGVGGVNGDVRGDAVVHLGAAGFDDRRARADGLDPAVAVNGRDLGVGGTVGHRQFLALVGIGHLVGELRTHREVVAVQNPVLLKRLAVRALVPLAVKIGIARQHGDVHLGDVVGVGILIILRQRCDRRAGDIAGNNAAGSRPRDRSVADEAAHDRVGSALHRRVAVNAHGNVLVGQVDRRRFCQGRSHAKHERQRKHHQPKLTHTNTSGNV